MFKQLKRRFMMTERQRKLEAAAECQRIADSVLKPQWDERDPELIEFIAELTRLFGRK